MPAVANAALGLGDDDDPTDGSSGSSGPGSALCPFSGDPSKTALKGNQWDTAVIFNYLVVCVALLVRGVVFSRLLIF